MTTKQAPKQKPHARTTALQAKTSKAKTAAQLDERRREVFKLHNQGVTLQALAARYGLSVSTVHADYRFAFDQAGVIEDLREERERMLSKLDQMEQDILYRAQQEGRVGDEKSSLARLRILERRSKLLGLDAAVKVAGLDGGALGPIVGVDVEELARIVLEGSGA